MNRRENMMRTLLKQKHERLPVYTVIDNFNFPQPLPGAVNISDIVESSDEEGFRLPGQLAELSKYYGTDTVLRLTPSVIRKTAKGGFQIRQELTTDGLLTRYTGKKGEMTSLAVPSNEAGTSFMTVHPVKEGGDYQILIEYFESLQYQVNEEHIRDTKEHLRLLGEEGIAYAVIPSSPVMDLTRTWVGLENFYFDLEDYSELVERALRVMEEAYAKQCEMIAEHTPCEVLVMWDDSNSLYLSPAIFERYALPAIKRFAEIAHRHKKILVMHTCGKFKALAELFQQSGIDAVDWVTPPPSGDINPAELQALWKDQITMMLACSPDVMRYGNPDGVKEHIRTMLAGVNLNGSVMVMLPPPYKTPIENLKAAVEILTEEFGLDLNRSREYGSIFDKMKAPVWSKAKTGAAPN